MYNKHLIRLCCQCHHDYLHHRLVCLQKMSSGLTPAHLTQPLFQAEAPLKRAFVWYIMLHPHNRVFNNKMGWTIDSQSRLDQTQGCYTEWNERSQSQKAAYHESLIRQSIKGKTCMVMKNSSLVARAEESGEDATTVGEREGSGWKWHNCYASWFWWWWWWCKSLHALKFIKLYTRNNQLTVCSLKSVKWEP